MSRSFHHVTFPRVPAGVMHLALGCSLFIMPAAQADKVFQSTSQQTTLIELFTSEGCSSCPPADKWVSQFKHDPKLWKSVIPIAWHVDYWDYIGWQDSLAQAEFADRQRQFATEGLISSVYTPGFVMHGQEWQGWFKNHSLPDMQTKPAEMLSATLQEQQVEARYSGPKQALEFHLVTLGFDVISKVRQGENAGKTLTHDFVVLTHVKSQSETNQAKLPLRKNPANANQAKAVVIWVNAQASIAPLQAVGGWLKD